MTLALWCAAAYGAGMILLALFLGRFIRAGRGPGR